MKATQWGLLIICSFLISPLWAAIATGNSAWVYDAAYDNNGNRKGITPGLYATHIKNYNLNASVGHKLTQLFSYGGFLKMFCLGSGGSQPNTPCTDDTLSVLYNISSTTAYANALNTPTKTLDIMPVVDGVLSGAFLTAFNTMDQVTANLFADKVARTYCADDNVAGIQFDLEPFDSNQAGQINFYMRIAQDLSGNNLPGKPDPLQCVNASHPNGRVFSIFTSARNVNATVATILNKYQNGYIIDTLYTLGPVSDSANSPTLYTTYISNEIKRMIRNAAPYQVRYQFAIPASATLEEFETSGNVASGYHQIDYIKNAIAMINLYARSDVNFRGISLWAWSAQRLLRNKLYTPSVPPNDVLVYLQQNL